MVNGIDPVFFKDCRADLHIGVWIFFAIFVFSTDDRVTIVVDKLFPDQEVAITVEKGLFRGTAELVLLSLELVRSKDGKDAKDEDDKEEDAEQTWDRREQRLNLRAHRWKLVYWSQGSQDTESPKSLKRVGSSTDGQQTDDADRDDKEIETVPRIPQIGFIVENKPHCEYLTDALKDEYGWKAEIDLLLSRGPTGFPIRVQPSFVVGGGKHKWVQDDGQGDKSVEKRPMNEPDQCLSKKVLIIQAE